MGPPRGWAASQIFATIRKVSARDRGVMATACLFLVAGCAAITTPPERALQAIASGETPAVPARVLSSHGWLRFRSASDPFAGYRLRRRVRVRVMTRAGRAQSRIEIPLEAWSRLAGVSASSQRPDGSERLELSPSAVGLRSLAPDYGLLYTDARVALFDVPGVDVGDVIEHEEVIESDQIFAITPWQLDGSLPVEWSRFEILVPAGWVLRFSLQDPSGRVRSEEQVLPTGERRITIEARGLAALAAEPFAPSPVERGHRVTLSVARVGDRAVFDSWDDLARWYAGRTHGFWELDPASMPLAGTATPTAIATVPAPAPATAIATAGDRPLEEKIFRWFRSRFRYVAIQEGLAAVEPHPARAVLEARFGDCKDLTTALVAVYRAAGIAAHPVLVSSRGRARRSPDVVSLEAFDHAIVALERPGGVTFLDPTSDAPRFGELPWADQGAEALILRGEHAERVVLPEAPKGESLEQRDWWIGRGASAGLLRLSLTARGPAAEPWRAVARGSATGPRLEDVMRGLIGGDPVGIRALSFREVAGDPALRIEATLDLPRFIEPIPGGELLPVGALFARRPELGAAGPRTAPLLLGPPRAIVDRIHVPIAHGEVVNPLPAEEVLPFPGGQRVLRVRRSRRSIEIERTLTSTVERIAAARALALSSRLPALVVDSSLGIVVTSSAPEGSER
ncbi:MAG: DUF3857 domain-containing protein [Deltaproteobacteria bacterium]|nr:DUF3857 domain-containing protein [Deltaproteobacteria bacterium]